MFAEDKTIKELKTIDKIVECINNKVYGIAVVDFIELADTLPQNSFNNYLKILCIPYLFKTFEKMVHSYEEPEKLFKTEIINLKEYLSSTSQSSIESIFEIANEFKIEKENENIEIATGEHYGNLFKGFSPEKYFNETKTLLKNRLEINNIDISNIKNWTILDQGCGGGRYSAAWALLGAKKVIGIDISEIGINDAVKRAEIAGIKNLEYKIGNVLDLPFENEEFDVVFSNGVLHHTKDWKKGVYEQIRVLKKNGLGWQYLIEQPGGIFWDKIEILRMLVRNVNKNFAIKVLTGCGIPNNRIFYMLDHVMVPTNTRVKAEDLETELIKNEAINIRRLKRGVNFDRVEYIHRNIPSSKKKFGVGENRYIFSK